MGAPPALVPLPRLYAILDLDLIGSRGLDPSNVLAGWLDAGVRLVQLRAKGRSFGEVQALADPMASSCRAAGALFIVNDRADVALLSGAAGAHVGQEDLAVDDVRRMLGADAIVGLSTHTEPQIRRALGEPISYLAIGPVFPTATKAGADPVVGLKGVRTAAALAASAGRTVVAIGGITLATAAEVLDAGAASVAVASGLLPAGDGDDPIRAWLEAVA